MTFCNFSAGHFICSQSWYAQNLSKIEMMDISYRNGLWCHWWTLLKRPLYLDDVALIVRSSLLVVDVGTIFVWIKSEGESWGNFHIVLNMTPIFGGRREKIFQLRCCQTPDPDLNQCILMLADECSWGESGYNDNLYPKIPQLDTWGPKCPAKTKYCDIQVTSVTHTDNTCNFFANYFLHWILEEM